MEVQATANHAFQASTDGKFQAIPSSVSVAQPTADHAVVETSQAMTTTL